MILQISKGGDLGKRMAKMIGIPFYKIKKGSRIVLYCLGQNGKKCYIQLISSGYCKLGGIIDNKEYGNYYEGNEILSNDFVNELKFDYILITIMDFDIAKSIRRTLLAMGINNEQILDLAYDKENPLICRNTFIMIDDIIQYIDSSYDKFGKYAKRPMEVFPELGIYFLHEDKNMILNKIKQVLDYICDDEKRIFLLLLMYECEVFDAECMERYMITLLNAKLKDDTLYGLTIDTTLMVFLYPHYVYNDFFKDRIKLQKNVCEFYGLDNLAYNSVNNNFMNSRRIAIVTERFTPNNVTDAPSQLVQEYAVEIGKLGYEVKIFVLYSYADDDIKNINILQPLGSTSNALLDYDKDYLKTNDIEIYDDFEINTRLRLEKNVKEVMKYNPKFIIDMADEMFVEAYVLADYFKIINLPMRGGAYSSLAHKYIVLDKKNVEKDLLNYHLTLNEVCQLDLGAVVSKTKKFYRRIDYGIPSDCFLIITVGSRLKYEISDEMIRELTQYIEEEKNVVWIIVGDKPQTDNKLYCKQLEEGKIVEWGYEEDICALYKICDVYFNPIRRGGGLSVRLAMVSGLPVIMSNQVASDSSPFINEKYIVAGGYCDMVDYLKKIKNDHHLYERLSNEMKSGMQYYSVKNDAKRIISCCES